MATTGKFVIPPDVGEPVESSPARQAPRKPDPTLCTPKNASDADYEHDSLDRSFLMTLLRALSAWHT